jgi:hypothetical protein
MSKSKELLNLTLEGSIEAELAKLKEIEKRTRLVRDKLDQLEVSWKSQRDKLRQLKYELDYDFNDVLA